MLSSSPHKIELSVADRYLEKGNFIFVLLSMGRNEYEFKPDLTQLPLELYNWKILSCPELTNSNMTN